MKKRRNSRKSSALERGYREVASVGGGANGDWALTMSSEDSEVWQNAWALTARGRDLARTNPIFQRYRELIWCSVFGPTGTMLRVKAVETEDRTVKNARERAYLRAYDARRRRVMEWAARKQDRSFTYEPLYRELGSNGSSSVQMKAGAKDVFACQMIEKAWREWQRAEFCDVRGTRTYAQIRQLRLWSAIRDGDFFIRPIADPKVNKFGFSLQLINAEWVDQFFNGTMANGDEVRMGIRYKKNAWGLGKPVSYFFIKRFPNDWQFGNPGLFNYSQGVTHDEIPADQIIHYARPLDADSTRPAPWIASTIPTARQMDQYAIAEVVAARAQACKVGWLWSDVVPEGGVPGDIDPRSGVPRQELTPGAVVGLPYGVKYTESDPKHPNGNFESFRKAQLRHTAAGMPGASYSELANDYEAINFSAGRLQRLATDGMAYLIQQFDIDIAERPIFEKWLEMALITGAIDLPLAKLEKFNAPHFQGPRSPGVDEIKEVTAAALRVANHFSSDQKECDKFGVDFEETLFEQAEADMLKEQFGVNKAKTVGPAPAPAQEDAESPEEDSTEPDESDDAAKKPAPRKKKQFARR